MKSAFLAEQISRSLRVYPDISEARVEVLEHGADWELVMDVTVRSPRAVERIIDSVMRELLPNVELIVGAPPIARHVEFRLPGGEAVHAEASAESTTPFLADARRTAVDALSASVA